MTRQVSAQALSRHLLNHPLQACFHCSALWGGAAQHRLGEAGLLPAVLGNDSGWGQNWLSEFFGCPPVPKAFIHCETGLLAWS